jgi:hypothetical protein
LTEKALTYKTRKFILLKLHCKFRRRYAKFKAIKDYLLRYIAHYYTMRRKYYLEFTNNYNKSIQSHKDSLKRMVDKYNDKRRR